jgi:hypothetical protein
MTKQIHVKLNYGPLTDKDVATQGVAVVDGLTNNAKLTNPPIKPADLKAQLETYASLIAAAADGSKKAITERKSLFGCRVPGYADLKGGPNDRQTQFPRPARRADHADGLRPRQDCLAVQAAHAQSVERGGAQ